MGDVRLTRDLHVTQSGQVFELKKGDLLTEEEARLLQLHDSDPDDRKPKVEPVGGSGGRAGTKEGARSITPRKGSDK